jgi:hypothetical protein
MGKKPGEVIKHSKPYIYVINANREWLVGTWSRMPSVSAIAILQPLTQVYWTSSQAKLLIPLRGDRMIVALGEDRLLEYFVRGYLVTILHAIKETSHPVIWVTPFPPKCNGTWVREITRVGRMFNPSFCLTPITAYI